MFPKAIIVYKKLLSHRQNGMKERKRINLVRMDKFHVYERLVGQPSRHDKANKVGAEAALKKIEIIKRFVAELGLSDAIFVT